MRMLELCMVYLFIDQTELGNWNNDQSQTRPINEKLSWLLFKNRADKLELFTLRLRLN